MMVNHHGAFSLSRYQTPSNAEASQISKSTHIGFGSPIASRNDTDTTYIVRNRAPAAKVKVMLTIYDWLTEQNAIIERVNIDIDRRASVVSQFDTKPATELGNRIIRDLVSIVKDQRDRMETYHQILKKIIEASGIGYQEPEPWMLDVPPETPASSVH